MRAELLQQTRLMAQAVPYGQIKELTGTEADLKNPVYQRMKSQLAAIRSATPFCRFVYLLGRNAENKLFFYVDSEPESSKDYSPPGQIYEEAAASFHRAYATRSEVIEGPYKDRWGKWVSGMAPIMDPQTALYGLAIPDDAQAMVAKGTDFYWKNGKKRLLEEVNNPKGELCKGPDLYTFVYDRNMTWLAHPFTPERIGQNWIDKKDWSGGKYFRKEIQAVAASSKGHGWVEFEYENTVNKQRDLKTCYVQGVDDLIVCAGVYKGDGKVLAMLGLDVDAREWNMRLARAAIPPLLLILVMVVILGISAALVVRRSHTHSHDRHWGRLLEPVTAIAICLVMTVFATWLSYTREIHKRDEAFRVLGTIRTQLIADALRTSLIPQLEGVSRFCNNNPNLTQDDFKKFIDYIVSSPVVQAWEWIPAVPAAEKKQFEEAARAYGMTGFEIWQRDRRGDRVPAADRDFYYPVACVTPLLYNKGAVGFDLGSEPIRRAALEEASQTRLSVGTDPITLVQESNNQKGMLVCRAVFDEANQLRGFALIVLRLRTLMRSTGSDSLASMELSLYHKDRLPESLAYAWNSETPPSGEISLTRPIFAYGKAFAVTARPGPEFMHEYHQVWAASLGAMIGFLLTGSLGIVVNVLLRRRDNLERLVVERTVALSESQARLEQSVNRLDLATQAGGVGIWDFDVVNNVLVWDKQMFVHYGIAQDSFGGAYETWQAGLHPEDRQRSHQEVQQALRGEKEFDTEFRVVWPNGEIHHVRAIAQVQRDVSGRAIRLIGTNWDITRQRQAEEELHHYEIQARHAQKLESIGNLASGIAHEINTPIQYVLSNVSFLQSAFENLREFYPIYRGMMERLMRGEFKPEEVAAVDADEKGSQVDFFLSEGTLAIEASLEGVERVRKIVRAMKEFSHPGEDKPTLIDLNGAIASTITVSRSEWKNIADLVTYFEADLPLVPCFSGEINQVILNLLVNSSHAIAEVVEKKKMQGEEEKGVITVTTRQNGDWAEILIGDSGGGIPEAVQARIFEPFFTTKGVGKGTGLGLSISHAIIEKKHGGSIQVETKVGQGTTFLIRLPLTSREPGVEKQKQFY